MLAYLKGNFEYKQPAKVVVDVNCVCYDVHIILHTYEQIQDQKSGLLFTYLHITENAQTLYGFAAEDEKKIFLHLISVSGIGATTARMMLSSMKPNDIIKLIVQSNTAELTKVKGIGKKTAELVVVSLRDKLASAANDITLNKLPTTNKATDAIEALISLGITKANAEKAVQKATDISAEANVETLIKLALKNM
jgi:Holliday junction DNA helicase RuvA